MTAGFVPLAQAELPGLYSLYRDCFPRLLATQEEFTRTMDLLGATRVRIVGDPAAPQAACILHGGAVLLLCVEPSCRGRGLGSGLLAAAEQAIAQGGHSRVVLGHGGGPYLFQGAPCPGPAEPPDFFVRRGYTARWVSLDMVMPLAGYRAPAQVLSAAPEGVTFGPAQPRERAAVLAAAELASAGWSVFYDQYYENAWVARAGDEVIGCLLAQPRVTLGAGFSGPTGGLACVGVVPQWRQRGIGLKLAAVATAQLARQGLAYAYVGYTWLENWYGRIGYRPYQYFWMGEKAL